MMAPRSGCSALDRAGAGQASQKDEAEHASHIRLLRITGEEGLHLPRFCEGRQHDLRHREVPGLHRPDRVRPHELACVAVSEMCLRSLHDPRSARTSWSECCGWQQLPGRAVSLI